MSYSVIYSSKKDFVKLTEIIFTKACILLLKMAIYNCSSLNGKLHNIIMVEYIFYSNLLKSF